jgi:hypothetical protein
MQSSSDKHETMLQAALTILQVYILHGRALRPRDFCLWLLLTWYFRDKIMLSRVLPPAWAGFCSLAFSWAIFRFLKQGAQLEESQMLDMIRLATSPRTSESGTLE